MIRHWSAKRERISHGVVQLWGAATPSVPTATLVCRESFSASSIFGSYQISRGEQYHWTASLIASRSATAGNVKADDIHAFG